MDAQRFRRARLADAANRWSMPVYRTLIALFVVFAGLPFLLTRRAVGGLDSNGFPTSAIANLGTASALILFLTSAFIVLPISPRRLVTTANGRVNGVTILGRRELSIDDLTHLGSICVYSGRGPDVHVVLLRARYRHLVVVDSYQWLPLHLREPVVQQTKTGSMRVSRRARWRIGLDPRPSRIIRVLDGAVTTLGIAAYIAVMLFLFSGTYWLSLTARLG